jgi:AraC-like DNA-binding protein
MRKLTFDRRKYGKELLIDATHTDHLNIVSDTIVQDFYTLIFLKNSSGYYHLDNEEIALGEHMVLFVKPGKINYVPKARFHDGYFLFFEVDFLDDFFSDKYFIYKFGFYHQIDTPSYLTLGTAEFDKYQSIAAEIDHEIKGLTEDSEHVLRSLIYYLLVRLNQAYGRTYLLAQHTLMEPKLQQFLKLLEKNVRNNYGVEKYAALLGISRVHLNKLSQKHFSKTSSQIIREYMLTEIKKAIRFEDKDLSQIAYDFHFSAPSHFTRFFKQMTDESPQDFRETISKW